MKSKIQGLVAVKGELYAICKGKFYKVDLKTGILEEKTGTTFDEKEQTNFVVYNDFVFCLDGKNFPKVFDREKNTWTVLDKSKIPEDATPRFGTSFISKVYLAGGGKKKNTLYISNTAMDNEPNNILLYEGDGTQKTIFSSPIEALASNKGKLYIFTETAIEVITKESITNTTNDKVTYYNTPIA